MTTRTVSVKLQAEIGQYVSGMSKAAAATMRVGESAQKSQAASSKGFDVAGKGALLLGGALVVGLGMAVRKAADFEKSMSAVGAATGATGATLDALRTTAIKAGADTQYSATEAAKGITEMAKAGVSAKDIMGGGLSGALSLAAAGQIDVADAAGIASTAMTQFGLKGAQIPHVADLLAAGAGKAMGSVDDLGMALNQAGLVASAAGLNIEETTGTLAAFASAGLLGSDAGTSLKTMLQKLQAPSGQAAQIMSDLGINMYDANGNMLGMAEMAGQLKTGLGNLTQEQRNSALATIFGSDAVRAANVLYNQGAKGIEDWTKKVNDQGYAMKQAHDLTNNLSGDLERLGGSFDTFLISAGSGSQGPLRELVQGLTGIVNVAGNLVGVMSSVPGPVWLVVGALAAAKLLGGPVTKMFQGIGFAVDVFTASAKNAGGPVAALKGTISGIASSISPAQVAIAGITMLIPALIEGFHELNGTTQATMTAQQGLVEALKATNGVIDENARKAAQNSLIQAGLVHTFDQAGVSAKDAIDGLLGNADAQGRVTAALQAYITANPGTVHNKTATAAMEARASYLKLAESLGISKEQAQFFADAATGAATSTSTGGDAAGNAAPKVATFGDELKNAADAASQAKSGTDLFKLSLDLLTGKTVDLGTVEAAFYDAVSKADGALKGMHGSVLNVAGGLNLQSEAGRKTQSVLFDIHDTADAYIATMKTQGATTAQMTAKDAEMRQSFYNTALAMTGSKAAAKRLTDQIYGIPASRTTLIKADVNQAVTAISTVRSMVAGLQNKTITVTTRTNYSDGSQTVHRGPGMAQAAGGIVHAYAAGGFEPMAGGVAQFVKPNTMRIIGDRVRDDEAYIPIDGSPRSLEILQQTNERMAARTGSRERAPISTSREFSGGGIGGGQTVVQHTDARQYTFNATSTQPTTERQFRDMVYTQEFLHG